MWNMTLSTHQLLAERCNLPLYWRGRVKPTRSGEEMRIETKKRHVKIGGEHHRRVQTTYSDSGGMTDVTVAYERLPTRRWYQRLWVQSAMGCLAVAISIAFLAP